jgi:hypothetical protein
VASTQVARPSDDREQLARGEVERVQGQTERLVLDEREEAEGAVLRPLNEDRLGRVAHARLDERRQLPDRRDAEGSGLERRAIVRPGRDQRGFGVVEQIDVARPPSACDDLVEGDATGDVALAGSLPLVR